jgi:hypothetical protein
MIFWGDLPPAWDSMELSAFKVMRLAASQDAELTMMDDRDDMGEEENLLSVTMKGVARKTVEGTRTQTDETADTRPTVTTIAPPNPTAAMVDKPTKDKTAEEDEKKTDEKANDGSGVED